MERSSSRPHLDGAVRLRQLGPQVGGVALGLPRRGLGIGLPPRCIGGCLSPNQQVRCISKRKSRPQNGECLGCTKATLQMRPPLSNVTPTIKCDSPLIYLSPSLLPSRDVPAWPPPQPARPARRPGPGAGARRRPARGTAGPRPRRTRGRATWPPPRIPERIKCRLQICRGRRHDEQPGQDRARRAPDCTSNSRPMSLPVEDCLSPPKASALIHSCPDTLLPHYHTFPLRSVSEARVMSSSFCRRSTSFSRALAVPSACTMR